MIINHNISSLFASRQIKSNSLDLRKSIEKLSSGMRINSASDDPAGLAVSEKMRAQVRGLMRAQKNSEDGISLIQTAEGYLNETTDVLQRLRELAVQAANGVYSDDDRLNLQVEVSQLVAEVDRIASHAQFNGMNILTGKFAKSTVGSEVSASMWFHVGANMDQRIRVYIGTMSSQGLGLKNPIGRAETATFISVSTTDKANIALGIIDSALMKVAKQRADLGAYQERLEYLGKGLLNGAENLQAAESRIRDTDMAYEMSNFVRNNILTQAATAMLAQANTQPQQILQLLR
ncbi:MAG: flagellin [Spirochaetes bacterium]|jgi:flagellin|nr:flagellin [Spirochaetota bacterium]NLJ04139.1 flagellin [Exilispira sp.]MBP8990606.1 flagellin [Spirochaetota bacterium]HNV43578.1 flagellin [Exilispira sp.]HOV45779.1 flagellin [Exilispira sp.]